MSRHDRRERLEALRAHMRALCEEPGPDDGLTRRELERASRPRRSRARDRRLGGQIARVLQLAFGTSAALSEVWIQACVPDPDAARFRVLVLSDTPEVLQHLHHAKGWLRTEIAHAIQRRKTPDLHFEWVPSDPDGGR